MVNGTMGPTLLEGPVCHYQGYMWRSISIAFRPAMTNTRKRIQPSGGFFYRAAPPPNKATKHPDLLVNATNARRESTGCFDGKKGYYLNMIHPGNDRNILWLMPERSGTGSTCRAIPARSFRVPAEGRHSKKKLGFCPLDASAPPYVSVARSGQNVQLLVDETGPKHGTEN